MAMELSTEQLDRFRRDGFLLLRNFASETLCDQIREAALEEIERAAPPIETEEEYQGMPQGSRTTLRRLRQVYHRHPSFRHWMHNEEIRPILEQLLKEPPVLTLAHHNSIMTKMPRHSTETCWHQDIRYWRFSDSNLLSVWLALGEERMENGLLEFIPGSHLLDLKPGQFDEKICFREDLPENGKILKERIHYTLQKGDVVLFHALTLHHAYENRTDKPKISIVYTVTGKSTRPIPNTRSAEGEEVPL